MATTMWNNQAPITGARINGSRERAGIAACFNDINGKPLAIQLDNRHWIPALKILGFHDSMEEKGLIDLGLAFESDEKKNEILDTLMSLFGTDTRERWVTALREADMVAAPVNTMLEASNDPNVVANGYVREVYHPKIQENIKIHGSPWNFSETPSNPGFAPELGEHNDEILSSLGYNESQIKEFRDNEII